MMRWVIAALAFVTASAMAAPPAARVQAEDFDAMWRAVDEDYAYFDRGRAAWKQAREKWRALAVRAASRAEFVAALEGALALLRDDHVGLSERSPAFTRRVPYETDIWPRWKGGVAVVEAVRTFSDADVAGLRPGQVIARVREMPVDRVAREELGAVAAGPAAQDWALRRALAGPRRGTQKIEVRDGTRVTTIDIERNEPQLGAGPPIVGRRMGEDRDIGYLRVRVGTGDAELARHFDSALDHLRDTRALIVDVRENAGPGSRAATLSILGRFAAAPAPWQVREARGRTRVVDSVAPRGTSAYRAPVVVLVDRWTAGEGEALAAGLAAVANARIVGTETAGLRGELREATLPHSGIVVRFPAERTFLVSGEPREALRPVLAVDLAAPSGGPGDPILYQALKLLERR
jgi:C-terminal processing protease CtpA/Prc